MRRFIPAGAGNTMGTACSPMLRAVHPRWRGEHATNQPGNSLSGGSSPLARGTRLSLRNGVRIRRFIPAGAGNTFEIVLIYGKQAVHPRWRGEHSPLALAMAAMAGSSPLARGTRKPNQQTRAYRRFIPAGAGNTPCQAVAPDCLPVHPRWRGEHIAQRLPARSKVGSSPLARGTRQQSSL